MLNSTASLLRLSLVSFIMLRDGAGLHH